MSSASYSQKINLKKTDVPIKEVLREIENQTGYQFLYADKVLKNTKPVTINIKNAYIIEALEQCFNGQPLTFLIDKNSIILKKKLEVPMPQFTLRGKILDEFNLPLPGATIVLKDTKISTISNKNGEYSINIPDKNADGVLIVSFIGYLTAEVPIKKQQVIDVSLKPNLQVLSEAVVVGYTEKERKDLTGAISSIKSDVLQQTGADNFSSALQGRVAGVKVTTQTGEAGGGVNITIRGVNSINAASTPLYIIDGMQIDINEDEIASSNVGASTTYNPLSMINPNDIASIDILKDASATAIYGSRGANGVIIVTTKSGSKVDKTEISLNYSTGVSKASKFINMAGAQDYVDYKFLRGDSSPDTYGVDTNGDGVLDTPVDASDFDEFNWQDLMLRQAPSRNYDLSLNSKAGKTRISSSVGYYDNDGIVINNNFKRFTSRIKLDQEINDKLSIGASANYGNSVNSGAVSSGGGLGSYSGIIQLIYLERPLSLVGPSETSDYPGGFTSLVSIANEETYKNSNTDRLFGNFNLSYKILEGLRFKLSASGNQSNSKLQEYYSSRSIWGGSVNGRATLQNNLSRSYNTSGTFYYFKNFNNKHKINALLGAEISGYHFEYFRTRNTNFQDETTGVFDISKGSIVDIPVSYVSQTDRRSMFSSIDYNYKSKYYLTVNIRADASSAFFKENRLGLFPSVAAAYRLSSEPFLKSVKAINDLKLRASYGVTGNDRISSYGAFGRISQVDYAGNGNTIKGISIDQSGNRDLKWETTRQSNLGLDLSLFDNRLSIVADWYNKATKNMLLNARVPSQTGFIEQFQNIGGITNRGIEISLQTTNVEKKNFRWSSSISFDRNRNKVTSLGDADFLPVTIPSGTLADVARVIVGQPVGTGFGYLSDGNYQTDDFDWVDNNNNPVDAPLITSENVDVFTPTLKDGQLSIAGVSSIKPGDRKYKDISGPDGVADGIVDAFDRTIISNSNPKFNLGIGNNFKIGNFDFNFFVEIVYGNQIMNAFKDLSEAGKTGNTSYNVTQDYFNNRWTPENRSNTYSRILNSTNAFISDYYVEDGSFVRLKNIGFGYSLNNNILKKLKLNSVRIYSNILNPFIITKYSGLDPDVRSPNPLFTGYDRLSYPRVKSFEVGLNVAF